MDVEMPPEFIADVLQSLWNMWGLHQKVFFLQDIKSITGKLGSASYFQTFKLLLYITNKQFRMLLKLQRDKKAPRNHHTIASAHTAKSTHLLRNQHFITTTLQDDPSLNTGILGNALVLWYCPIAHLILLEPSTIACSDSSSHAVGGFLDSLSFWWHLQWPWEVQARTAKVKSDNTTSINALEYATFIINYVVALAALLQQPHEHDPFPSLLLFTNNITSEAWIIKGDKNPLQEEPLVNSSVAS